MPYQTITADEYRALLAALPDGLRALIAGLDMPDAEAAEGITFHAGDATSAPPKGHRYVVVDGDLTVFGRLNMFDQVAGDEDGNTVLIVTGNLRCADLIQTHGGVILVGGNLKVSGVFEASLGNSMSAVLGSVSVRFYHGLDIWIEFGERCEIDTGWGYGLPLGYTNAGVQAVYPVHQGEAIYDHFGIAPGDPWERTDAFVTMMLKGR